MASVMPVRTLVGVAALTAALGLTLLGPVGAHAATVPGTSVATALPTLRAGAAGTSVASVQRILAIRQTGVYDSATVAAVKRLQTWKRIYPVNGVVGPLTWIALRDVTLSSTMRTSRAARAALAFATWQASVHGRGIVYRESKGSCTVLSYNHQWRGKWQMTLSLWRANGGLAFASAPEKATCLQQDKVAHNVWVAGGWGSWGG